MNVWTELNLILAPIWVQSVFVFDTDTQSVLSRTSIPIATQSESAVLCFLLELLRVPEVLESNFESSLVSAQNGSSMVVSKSSTKLDWKMVLDRTQVTFWEEAVELLHNNIHFQ